MVRNKTTAAPRTTRSSVSFRRHIAPLIPLATALVGGGIAGGGHTAAAPPPAHRAGALLFDGGESCSNPRFPSAVAVPIDNACNVEGSGGTEANQNAAKNNFCADGNAPSGVTLADFTNLQHRVEQEGNIAFGKGGKNPGPQVDRSPLHALGEGSLVQMTAFVKVARQEGPESVNCGSMFPDKKDTESHDIHISLVQNSGDDECQGIVAEMIPHHRLDVWTADNVNKVAGQNLLVRVTGQQMFDSSHAPCTNGAHASGDPARVSLWEIHPIYAFEVCPTKGSSCANGGWVSLELWAQGQQ